MNFGEIDITHEPNRVYFVWRVNKQRNFFPVYGDFSCAHKEKMAISDIPG
jgi:hypothetical protein